MSMFRRSTHHRGGKRTVSKNMADDLGNKIVELKVRNSVIDQLIHIQIIECKVDKSILNRPLDVLKSELKKNVASSRLRKNNSAVSSENSVDLNLAAHDGTASYQQAPALPSGSPPAMRAPKRKRCRPHKSNPSVSMALAIMPAPHQPPSANATQRVTCVEAAGSGVNGINHKVVTIQAGEDVATRIISFSENGWLVCILSAHGVVSNVTLRQGTSSHETIIYEGYFEILSLSGTYQPSETNGMRSLTGELTVSLATPHGRIFGGGVAGALIAASPIQVVIGRIPVDDKNKLKQDATSDIPGASSSTPRGDLNGSSGRPRSPLNRSASGSLSTRSHPVVPNIP